MPIATLFEYEELVLDVNWRSFKPGSAPRPWRDKPSMATVRITLEDVSRIFTVRVVGDDASAKHSVLVYQPADLGWSRQQRHLLDPVCHESLIFFVLLF